MNKTDVAVIGMSCGFSNAEDINRFWNNLREGKEMLRYYSPEEFASLNGHDSDPDIIGVGSDIKGRDSFDYLFFGYTKDEAAIMDPQIRVAHEYTWKALEDAGYDPFTYSGKIGAFFSASENVDWLAYSLLKENHNVNFFFKNQIANRTFLSTLMSYKLNLKGPSYFIDTACSSSLAAIHLACRNLLMKECNMAISGSIRISSSKNTGHIYEEGMINSKDGHCRAFDENASGTVWGEGVGIVVLKRLDDAIDGGDRIYAVIKSSAVNNDGSRKVGYTAPSAIAQAECITSAHKIAGIRPETISYIEAHGTGTKLGDPIEVEALNKAFNNKKDKFCALGSVKTNMGHLDTAAGIAGFIKTVLALYNKEIPPSLHFEKPNSEINFDDGPFYVNARLKKWERNGNEPLRAGVSSFGIGGTNVHVVLEEAPLLPETTEGRPFSLLLCSGKSKSVLSENLKELVAYLTNANEDLPDIAYTLQCRRKHFRNRHFLVCENYNDAIDNLMFGMGGSFEGEEPPKIVFMFSGQGSQYVNMGRKLYESEPVFKDCIDKGLSILETLTGENHYSILYGDEVEVNENKINNTLYAQPILFVFEYALAQLLIKWGICPNYMIGHSIGEYVAACISGVYSFDDGLNLVLERGRLMNGLPGGSMLSIRRNAAEIGPLLGEDISIAAVNSADLCVVSGTDEDIERLIDILNQKGIYFVRLKTSHAFHSKSMEPIVDKFREKAASIKSSRPKIPFVLNVSGKFPESGQMDWPDYWSKHLRETVLFSEGIKELAQGQNLIFLEVGPGNTLTSLCRQTMFDLHAPNAVLNIIRHPLDKLDDQRLLTERIGELWLKGIPINWQEYYKNQFRRNVSIPTYCFERNSFESTVDPMAILKERGLLTEPVLKNPDISRWFYLPGWKSSSLIEEPSKIYGCDQYLIFSDRSSIAADLKIFLMSKGHNVVEVIKGESFEVLLPGIITMNSSVRSEYSKLADYLRSINFDFDQVVFMWGRPDLHHADQGVLFDNVNEIYYSFLKLFGALNLYESDRYRKVFFITDRLHSVVDQQQEMNIDSAAASGVLKVCSQENPYLFCCEMDISSKDSEENMVKAIYREFRFNYRHNLVCLDGGQRWVRSFEQVYLEKQDNISIIKNKGTYLITGGLGQLGSCLAEHLLSKYQANVILTGRTQLQPNNELDKINRFERLKRCGGNVAYYSVDLAEYDELAGVIKQVESTIGKIDGIIHAAGNLEPEGFAAVHLLDEVKTQRHFLPKIKGLLNLSEIFRNKRLDFAWLTSSLSSILGGLTYGAYAASNVFMDYFVSATGLNSKGWISVDLDGLELSQRSANAISGPELIEVFERSFRVIGCGCLAVSIFDLNARLERAFAPRFEALHKNGKSDSNSHPLAVNGERKLNHDVDLALTDTERELSRSMAKFLWQR